MSSVDGFFDFGNDVVGGVAVAEVVIVVGVMLINGLVVNYAAVASAVIVNDVALNEKVVVVDWEVTLIDDFLWVAIDYGFNSIADEGFMASLILMNEVSVEGF
ncbi:hypothetical protein NDU88_000248 [Pleurodeles waltl]|uniref:Transmembrane protein n=1 Tax=Pleurodeles waltl TaxID=8319 RepID=A0AAV7VXJ8_PLEWA|nr:hypothetical protein NDU88_000248 [Pleurodeles waltl]